VLVSSAINYVNVINYKQTQEQTQVYQQEYGLSSQDAQEAQDEQYSNPNIKGNSLFTVPLDFERLPFVELRLINAGEIGRSKVLNFDIHICRPSLKSYYHWFYGKINSIRHPRDKYDGPKENP
jgi:hypothetical protein